MSLRKYTSLTPAGARSAAPGWAEQDGPWFGTGFDVFPDLSSPGGRAFLSFQPEPGSARNGAGRSRAAAAADDDDPFSDVREHEFDLNFDLDVDGLLLPLDTSTRVPEPLVRLEEAPAAAGRGFELGGRASAGRGGGEGAFDACSIGDDGRDGLEDGGWDRGQSAAPSGSEDEHDGQVPQRSRAERHVGSHRGTKLVVQPGDKDEVLPHRTSGGKSTTYTDRLLKGSPPKRRRTGGKRGELVLKTAVNKILSSRASGPRKLALIDSLLNGDTESSGSEESGKADDDDDDTESEAYVESEDDSEDSEATASPSTPRRAPRKALSPSGLFSSPEASRVRHGAFGRAPSTPPTAVRSPNFRDSYFHTKPPTWPENTPTKPKRLPTATPSTPTPTPTPKALRPIQMRWTPAEITFVTSILPAIVAEGHTSETRFAIVAGRLNEKFGAGYRAKHGPSACRTKSSVKNQVSRVVRGLLPEGVDDRVARKDGRKRARVTSVRGGKNDGKKGMEGKRDGKGADLEACEEDSEDENEGDDEGAEGFAKTGEGEFEEGEIVVEESSPSPRKRKRTEAERMERRARADGLIWGW